MNRDAANDLPAELGLLADTAVAKFLTRGMQAGQEKPPLVALRKASIPLPSSEARWSIGPIRELLDVAMERFEGRPTEADGWLSPRLHATLRMTRAEAADSRLWNYLAMIAAPDYVVWRHKGAEIATASRFSGPHYTQAFARLWWAAELFRNGDDYSPVEVACSVQDVLNTTMRLDVIDHRPTAIAIIHVVDELKRSNASRLGDRVNALSSAVNAAGSTLLYDVMAPDEPVDHDALEDWIAEAAGMAPVRWDRLPEGPDDGEVSEEAVEALIPLFGQLLEESPMRLRKKAAAPQEH
ncbi:DUF6339 family protein [Amycolatopsis japonica]|uniref:DUF6339 family protein n=1 Tax=Amycolatopsis japonica TaxID=208439 RepID=UPI00381C22D1